MKETSFGFVFFLFCSNKLRDSRCWLPRDQQVGGLLLLLIVKEKQVSALQRISDGCYQSREKMETCQLEVGAAEHKHYKLQRSRRNACLGPCPIDMSSLALNPEHFSTWYDFTEHSTLKDPRYSWDRNQKVIREFPSGHLHQRYRAARSVRRSSRSHQYLFKRSIGAITVASQSISEGSDQYDSAITQCAAGISACHQVKDKAVSADEQRGVTAFSRF